MKTRNGFVSNSSSSSFIIGVNNIDCEILKELEYCFELYADNFEEWSNSCITDVTKQWNKNDEYNYKYLYRIEIDWNDEELNECIRYIFEDKIGEQIETGVKGKSFEIIEGWY